VTNTTLKPPFFLVVYEADGLRISDIHFRQSPRWTTMIHSSKNVAFSHVSMIKWVDSFDSR
jgi:galacturan 1,4-alpha-galacturonidase